MNKDGAGVSPAAVRDAVRNPTLVEYQQKNDTYIYVGRDATVVLDTSGRLVTAYATSRAGWRGPR